MRARGLMMLGAFTVVAMVAMDLMTGGSILTFTAAMGGAVFGKGYGIWEMRSTRPGGRT